MNQMISRLNKLYWIFAFSILFYFILFVLPKKGFDLSDHGMYTTAANDFLHGIFNEWGLSGLLNALLIKLGFGYLNLSRFFYFLEFFSGFLFVMSLRLRASFYWVAPLGVILMIASSPVHMFSYETAGPIILMIATSLLFFALNYPSSQFWKNFCYALSALFYIYSSTTNLMLIPTLLTNAIILFFIYPKIKNKTFIITYFLFFLISLYLVFFKILPVFKLSSNIFYHHGYFFVTLLRIFKDFLMILGFIFIGFISTKCISFVVTKISKKINQIITLIIITALLWLGLRIYFHHLVFLSWKNSLLVYGFIYLGAIFAIYNWRFYLGKTQLFLSLALLLHTEYYLVMAGADGLPWSIRSFPHASQIALIALLWLEYFFLKEKNTLCKVFVTLLLFFGIFLYPIQNQFRYAYAQFPKLNTEKITDIKSLRGIYMRPDQLNSVRKVINTYDKYHCNKKLFIARQSISLFYFIFNRIGLSPLNFPDSKNDLKRLYASSKKHGFCFIGDIRFENFHSQNPNDPYFKLRHWLQAHSKKIIFIPINGSCCGPFYVHFYVG